MAGLGPTEGSHGEEGPASTGETFFIIISDVSQKHSYDIYTGQPLSER